MGYYIGKFIFFLLGWKLVAKPPKDLRRCVMIAAPHTSNWDFVIARAAFAIMRIPVKFTIKKEWFRFPFNLFFNLMGGIAIDRSPKEEGKPRKSSTEAMAELFQKYKDLVVLVTPEGTRKKQTEWKTGFYYVAKMAGVPIACGWLDYSKKHAGVGLVLQPTDNMEQDLQQIMQFYRNIAPKFQENFSVDTRFV
jgi:1-acyl-sn-glycerol-3-phosphate acyltransferase